jgi:hypothetical protein
MANKRNSQREGQRTCEHAHTHAHKKSLGKERQQRFRNRKKQRLKEVTNIVNTTTSEDSPVNLEISTSRVNKHFVIQWYEQTTRGIEFQRLFLPKILKHPIWKGVMSSYIEMEHAFNAVGNIAKGWQQIKGCHWKDDQRARNVIIPMILSESISRIHKISLLRSIHH